MRDLLTRGLGLWTSIQSYVTLGLGAALAVTGLGWYITDVKLERQVTLTEACSEGRLADRATYVAEQAKYEAEAQRQAREAERIAREQAEQADARVDTLYREYQSNLLHYRRTIGSTVRGDNLPSTSGTAELDNGPSGSPEFPSDALLISVLDADICAKNTARLVSIREWATNSQ